VIVTVADLCAHLGLTEGDDVAQDALLEALSTRVEGAFLAACNRTDRPFLPASTAPIEETIDGTGTGTLFTSRPITSLVSVTVGSTDTPTATYLAAALTFTPGRTIVRARDTSVVFGTADEPSAVTVTYTPAADEPEDVKLAIAREVAKLFLQRGAEDVSAESEGGVRSDLAAAFSDPTWLMAVEHHREPQVG
jgi:hypothetical protein